MSQFGFTVFNFLKIELENKNRKSETETDSKIMFLQPKPEVSNQKLFKIFLQPKVYDRNIFKLFSTATERQFSFSDFVLDHWRWNMSPEAHNFLFHLTSGVTESAALKHWFVSYKLLRINVQGCHNNLAICPHIEFEIMTASDQVHQYVRRGVYVFWLSGEGVGTLRRYERLLHSWVY